MANKFYAVKIGRNPGVYTTWEACKKQVDGYSGAVYKSFSEISEAEAFIGKKEEESSLVPSDIIAYVDGSYDNEKKLFSYGVVIIIGKDEFYLSQKFDNSDPDRKSTRLNSSHVSESRMPSSA